ncbi:MAG TPA: GvpL/GvpF family gas vesicle protein, partial [Nitrososphaera sp.]|nr:GvpL/GvpF family gas vesicle protein [Nitrososphaera sp.]
SVELESAAIQKLKDEISSSPNKGRAYFLKMKLQDALKTETLRKIDDMSSIVHQELVGMADKSVKLRSDVNQVILNASYLVDRSRVAAFEQKVLELRQQFAARGLTIHTSGPWAPYSFC